MKVPYSWLREWIAAPWDARELGSRLTMSGFELEAVEAAAPPFSGVIVAEILEAVRHPQADKLQVCRVSTGQGEPIQIVCGAPNARAGLKSALAVVGAVLPGDFKIKVSKLRGVESVGMLCSSKELGLSEGHAGIIELPADAPVGHSLREYLQLDDLTVEFNVTPNRGDAMSVLGIAREVAALSGQPITGPKLAAVSPKHDVTLPVRLDAPAACPRFVGRLIRGIDNRAATPTWMRERLRRAGLRSISPVVDVTNYVVLELGQPMHAYDHSKLQQGIHVRLARADEPMTLLDERAVKLDADMLVIADDVGPVCIAGVMGGERTAVTETTTDVFLEVAFFAPDAIAGRARRLGIKTDASQRFERGVDPAQQERAMERATALILAIAGGSTGPSVTTQAVEHLPRRNTVHLRRSRLALLLGTTVDDARVEEIFRGLQMRVERAGDGWDVVPPSHRFDIAIEADLIEEVARIVGFDAIPEAHAPVAQRFVPLKEGPTERAVLEAMVSRGYHEVITFSFVDPALQTLLFPQSEAVALSNPITSDLSVMRVSLWPGLLKIALENQRRQHDRIRLFEHATKFVSSKGAVQEVDMLAGLALGQRLPEQWGTPRETKVAVDVFDIKADVEALLAGTGEGDKFSFEAGTLPCLHPGRSARILRDGQEVGWIGELHPSIVRTLAIVGAPVLFEVEFERALAVKLPRYGEISRFPQVRRDIAVVVDESVSLSALRERVRLSASNLLQKFHVFDLYRGSGVEHGRKSVALGLIFQDISRTLTDEDVDRVVASIVADLRASLDARIRE